MQQSERVRGRGAVSRSIAAPLVHGRYELVGLLGQGGFGTVYEAIDRKSGERVAIKQLRNASDSAIGSFKREFRALQELSHTNLVRLDALFEEGGIWMMAMELVEGSDLLEHVYAAVETRCFDEERLVEAFGQLAAGLTALHTGGFVHRDLKPANVRVTPEGRTVLLDFGLATAADPKRQSSRAGVGGGTVAYMAPEQAVSHKVGPPADWYAFGVCLYEAMTGVLPVDADNPFALLQAKMHQLVPAPSTHGSGIPEDLDLLCKQLLAIEPDQRPNGAVVRSVLARGALVRSLLPERGLEAPSGPQAEFAGRTAELSELAAALGRAQAGTPQVVLIEGESGIGKSALVQQFLESQPGAIVLRSRCYENELLAFKAIDGATEALASVLCRLTAAECDSVLPLRAGLLCRLFPALAAVPALARSPLRGLAADPSLQQLEAFSVFARLIAGLGQHKPVLFAIDDLQWADVDSFRMLKTWLSLAPSRCLILATVRPSSELEGEAAQAIAALAALPVTRTLRLTGLPVPSAHALARELLGAGVADDVLGAIVAESGGHPLFLAELARFVQQRALERRDGMTLDAAISNRLTTLPSKARTLFETVAVAGSPLSATALGRALDLQEVEVGRIVTELCRHKLLRRRSAGEVACFHDRIRAVALSALPRAQQRALHGRLADALAARGEADLAEIGRHHEAAGELVRALDAYRRAADRALQTLAFARAELLYSRALEVAAQSALAIEERIPLWIGRGHALARTGRSAHAAREYLAAATHARGEQKTMLQIWGAQHLLQSAHVEEGMAAARTLMHELDLPLPSSAAGALAGIALDHILLAFDGRALPKRRAPEDALDPRRRMQLDALSTLTHPLGAVDPLVSLGLNMRYFRLARRARDPEHMVRSLAEQAFLRVVRDTDDPGATRMIEQARSLIAECQDPELALVLRSAEARIATLRDEPNAEQLLTEALTIATERCPDRPWLLTNLRINLASRWYLMGEHARLATSTEEWLVKAHELDDRYATALIQGFGRGFLRMLMVDEPDRARAAIDGALGAWPPRPFSFVHFGRYLAMIDSEIYRGGAHAYRWVVGEGASDEQATLMKVRFGRHTALVARAKACLAACHEYSGDRARVTRFLEEAERCVNAAVRVDLKAPRDRSALRILALQLAAIRSPESSASLLDQARSSLSDLSPVHSLGYLCGVMEGGARGAERCRAALDFFAAQGWRNPRRPIALWCPAVDFLESRSRTGR